MQTNDTLMPPIGLPKRKIKYFLATLSDKFAEIATCYFKWLTPGLSVKRWLVVNIIGILLTNIGLASFLPPNLVISLITFIGGLSTIITNLVPSYVCSLLITLLGLCLVFFGQTRVIKSITEVIKPQGNQRLVDILLSRRRLHRGAKIVAIGGGTGLSSLLRGLKHYTNKPYLNCDRC